MRLTDQQLAFFDTFGFLAFPGLFADDIDKITDAFEKGMGQTTAAAITGRSTTASNAPRSSSSSTRTSTSAR